MLTVILFILALLFSFFHFILKRNQTFSKVFIHYVLLFNVGIMGFLAAYAHIFMGPETAEKIGWQPGSPFQFEIGMGNLSYGVIGILSFWQRGKFAHATIIGWSIFVLGCFVGHIIDYLVHNNTHPYNIGIYVWFNDLFLPLFLLGLLICIRTRK